MASASAAGKGKAKKAKPAKVSEGEARKTVLTYMRAQNRPFNSKMVFENLHGALMQAQVTKALDDLAEAGTLVKKENKKQHVYWIAQDSPELLPSAADGGAGESSSSAEATMAALDAEAQTSKQGAADTKAKADALAAENRRLAAEPGDADAAAEIARLRAETAAMEAKCKTLREATVKVSRAELERAEKQHAAAKAVWKKRRRMCRDIADAITESSGQKFAAFAEELGLEVDNDPATDDEEAARMRKRAKK